MKRRLLAALAGLILVLTSLIAPSGASAASWNSPYLAFGDSYAAGTGLAGASGACLTAPGAYPHLLSTRVDSLACAGATSADLAAQIAAAQALSPAASPNGQRTLFRAQQVTLTLGVNDLGWSQAAQTCLTSPVDVCLGQVAQVVSNLNGQQTRTAASVMALRAAAPKATILVTGYPRPFDVVPGSGGCLVGWAGPNPVVVDEATGNYLDSIFSALNVRIAQGVAAVGDPNVVFVDVSDDFAGHGLCRGSAAWINGFVGDTTSLHLNAAGEQAYAGALRGALG